ncbi:MAG: YceI family protein [Acidobacteria bacterium]|nr:MAG: YceI family protein [Acidobacteriota bacterium]
MIRNRALSLLIVLLPLLILAGCAADPAADAPKAEVKEPAATGLADSDSEVVSGVTYAFSPESKIEFVGSKVTGSHNGGFKSFTGEVTVVDQDPTRSKVKVEIDTTSLWADNERLTGHLKSADFFDVETYPTASFESTAITDNGDGTYTITGNLNLHGVTKEISFPATIELTDDGFTAQAEFSIKRFDFGIEYKGKADDLIRDEVLIKLDLRSAPAAAAAA